MSDATGMSLDEAARLVLDQALAVTGLERGRLFLRGEHAPVLTCRATSGWPSTSRPPEPRTDDPALRELAIDLVRTVPGAGCPLHRSTRDALLIGLPDPGGDLLGIIALDGAEGLEPGLPLRSLARLASALLVTSTASRRAERAHQDLVRQHRSARTAAAVERQLGGLVGGRGGARAIVAAAAELSGKFVVLYRRDGAVGGVGRDGVTGGVGGHDRLTCDAGPRPVRQGSPPIAALLAATGLSADELDGPLEVPPQPLAGLARRHLLVPVQADGVRLGWLVMAEHPTRLQPLDTLVARCTAAALARELLVQRRVANVAWNARSSLARQLIRGSNDVDDLHASAEYLGVDPATRRVLVYALGAMVDAASGERRLAELLQARLDVEVLATRGSEGVLLLVQVPDTASPVEFVSRVKGALRSTAAVGFGDLTAGLSGVCDPTGFARAYREAREVAHCIDRFAPSTATRVLAVDDLGPARLFIANSAVSAVRAYVGDVLGALLTGDAATADLLTTLGSYFDFGRSVRMSAAHLGVHENTVRLRLARIHAATGLDVATDANDQLSAQTALLVLRLQGHTALASFDVDAATARVRTA